MGAGTAGHSGVFAEEKGASCAVYDIIFIL